eukprot:755901-Hanusia_phi.AAC.1
MRIKSAQALYVTARIADTPARILLPAPLRAGGEGSRQTRTPLLYGVVLADVSAQEDEDQDKQQQAAAAAVQG